MTRPINPCCAFCDGEGSIECEVDAEGNTRMFTCVCRDETQESIEEWRVATFGAPPSAKLAAIRLATRANKEMAELLHELSAENAAAAAEEIADVVIVLYGIATRLGFNVQQLVNRKMDVNRSREWVLDGTGHGHHVRQKREQ